MTRPERLAALLLLLQSHRPRRLTAGEIAAHFALSRRTVLRDMAALSAMGVPLDSTDGVRGGYRLADDYRPAPLPLTPHEASLLLLALGSLNRLSSAPFGPARDSLTAKLRALLSESQRTIADRWSAKLSVDVPDRETFPTPFLDILIDATNRGGWARTCYRSESGGEAIHTLLPRHLTTSGGFWYCRAWSHERAAERTFRVDRFLHVELTPPPPDAVPGTEADATPYDHLDHPQIEAHLTPYGVAVAEREPHVGQTVVRAANGSGSLTFRCPPSELDYWARYFFRLGADAHVVAPPELRTRIVLLAEKIRAAYAKQ